MLYFEIRNRLDGVIGTKTYERYDEAVRDAKKMPEAFRVVQMIEQYGKSSYAGEAWRKKVA
jgi:hypothetical protein